MNNKSGEKRAFQKRATKARVKSAFQKHVSKAHLKRDFNAFELERACVFR